MPFIKNRQCLIYDFDRPIKIVIFLLISLLMTGCLGPAVSWAETYTVVDTGQENCYDNTSQMNCPSEGQVFYGQDAQYSGYYSAYQDNGDGTVSDLNTGLMWQKDLGAKVTFAPAVAEAETFDLAGYDDWRLPTIKELYSLIQFYGSSFQLIPYIDTDYFEFEWGNVTGERVIDSQFWSSTVYVGFGSVQFNNLVFGVNFADGRIKGYPADKANYVRYVRGSDDYGQNNFIDNGDDTISDTATGLMWLKIDSGAFNIGINGDGAVNWEEALNWAESLVHAGYDDWRLPNAKELQSIVDYSRAPDAADPEAKGPAIDPIFDITQTESWFWTSTTHLDSQNPEVAVYICFGLATGYEAITGRWINVHGAGAQRSDPKFGDPADYPQGRGPQGDEIRIYNYVRPVRDGSGGGSSSSGGSSSNGGGCFLSLIK